MWDAILDGQPIIISNIQSLMTKAEFLREVRVRAREIGAVVQK